MVTMAVALAGCDRANESAASGAKESAIASTATKALQLQSARAVKVDFVRDIRPIISDHCFACHGPDEHARQAGLSLVHFETATSELDSGAPGEPGVPGIRAIAPGDLANSMLWQRINHPDDMMPPAEAHNPLDQAQIETLGRWIEQGASYAPHWAYVAPVATETPEVQETTWPLDAIDHYILARLNTERLDHAPDADDVTLLRRLTYDLTGLPPQTSDIDAFLADESPNAYETVVDNLLASPHFGERIASYWLDLVRYADTVGYHGDQEHRVWPYRDYVIRAFNENMPFDQFTIEQLAGDLLSEPGQQQLIATGYNRLIQTSHEGGVQLKEYRSIYMADRIRNASAVWMGATLGCAQCHDHKYDPYATRDFYAFGAFFADIDDEEHLRKPYDGLNTTPTRRLPEMRVTSADSQAQLDAIALRIDETKLEVDRAIAALPGERAAWEQALLAEIDAASTHEFVWVDDQLDTGGETQGDWSFIRDEAVPAYSGQAYRKQSSAELVQHYSVNTTAKTIVVAEGDTFFSWVYVLQDEPAQALMLQFNVAGNWEHRAVWGGDEIPYGRRSPSWAGYQRRGDLPELGKWVCLEVEADSVGLQVGQVVSGIAFTQFGGVVYWDKAGVRSDQAAPAAVIDALATNAADRSDAQRAQLHDYQLKTAPVVVDLRARIAELQREQQSIESSLPMTLYTKALAEPREVRVLPRGNWLDESGELVEPAIPGFLGTLDVDGRATRLDLARWLVTPKDRGGGGELTARVFVNRIWALFYGEGLCPSTDDFGGQGQPPNHLELLDRLSLDFVQSGWDVKALIRRLVLTRTYRQSSIPTTESAQRDPLNHFFAHQSRQRFPVEMIRDTALMVSGLLVDQLGGVSVKPPQPDGYYRHLNFPTRRYHPDTGAAQFRRGVYVHWQRQYLHPMFRAFDGPTREECIARRAVSNTPLAALALMNDPTFVEASRAFAQQILSTASGDDHTRIARAMRQATGRRPDVAEVEVLAVLLEESRQHYQRNPDDAEALLALGESPRDAALDPANHAAWTQVTRAILNLHETITRD